VKISAALAAPFAAICAVATLQPLAAMSVRAPTFPELVAESSAVVRVRVASVTSQKVTTARGEAIKTFVTYDVAKSLKGSPSKQITLAFLGGQVGDLRLDVPGMPTFQVGAEDYLFISAKPSFCPLVGAMHGRYHILTAQKPGRPYVARDDRGALVDVRDIVRPMHASGATAQSVDRALSPEAFEQLIAAEVAQPTTPSSLP
jgi:hypothetical protein